MNMNDGFFMKNLFEFWYYLEVFWANYPVQVSGLVLIGMIDLVDNLQF